MASESQKCGWKIKADVRLVALEKIRSLLGVLRRYNFGQRSPEDNAILIKLKSLQQTLRYIPPSAKDIDPLELISPFLGMIRAVNTMLLKILALECIVPLMDLDLLCNADALAEVVDTVSKCEIVSTENQNDDLMQSKKMQTLLKIVQSHLCVYLSDNATWSIIQTSFSLLLQLGMKEVNREFHSQLYHTTELTLLTTVKFVFSHQSLTSKELYKTGLPCAIKVFSFFSNILQKSVKNLDSSDSKASVQNGMIPLNITILELLLSIKVINTVVLSELNQFAGSYNLIISCQPLLSIIRDDIGRAIVLLAANCQCHPFVLQSILNLFSTLLASLGPSIRVLVECFMKFVYLKSLNQLSVLLKTQHEVSQGLLAVENGDPLDVPKGGYKLEALELVLESLVDLVSDAAFLPSLFASFDCDPSKSDIAKPLVVHLSRCTRYYLMQQNKELGQLQDLGALCNNSFNLLVRTLSDRCSKKRVNGSDEVKDASDSVDCDDASKSAMIDGVSRYLHCTRLSKTLLKEASQLFIDKPERGLKYLQEEGALPTPLTASSVSTFLRLAQDIPKRAIGAYLGEKGTDKPGKYEGEMEAFHQEVLLVYVSSFTFNEQSILDCLRIFLSAFWLPGEAQQIDRILMAFSEHCHRYCSEGRSREIQNPEVAYLLSYSIIMLQTDLHNPNIKQERKMTVEQFVRNNTNYGRDCNQTVPLTREFLEGIYQSIALYPLRTENNDLSGQMTHEMWMDLQLQADMRPEKGMLLTASFDVSRLQIIKNVLAKVDLPPTSASPSDISAASKSVPFVTLQILTQNESFNPLALSEALNGYLGFVDIGILKCMWQEILGVGICPLIAHRLLSKGVNSDSFKSADRADVRRIRIGIDILLTLIKLLHQYGMFTGVETVLALLAETSGILSGKGVDVVLESLKLDFNMFPLPKADPASNANVTSIFVDNLLRSLPARASLGTLLQIIHNNPNYVGKTWGIIWHLLGVLRDCTLLPRDIVIDADSEAMPDLVKSNFEDRLLQRSQSNKPATRVPNRKPSNLFSFFRSPPRPENDGAESPSVRVDDSVIARWDSGYESVVNDDKIPDDPESVKFRANYSVKMDATQDAMVETALGNLRELVMSTGISNLIADTRFMSEEVLKSYLTSLILHIQRSDKSSSFLVGAEINTSSESNGESLDENEWFGRASLESIVKYVSEDVLIASQSSCCWMEIILVDSVLRNRDRFWRTWPLLASHYRSALTSATDLSYTLERRVVGLFKVANRLLSREKYAGPILTLLGTIFKSNNRRQRLETDGDRAPGNNFLPHGLLDDVSELVAEGMWRLVTMNVSALPLLQLEQWQIIFDLIAIGAGGGPYSSIKSFEAMAWLLHEPRLKAEVPVFCVIGLRPLLCNIKAPTSVSIGAINLLSHLHSRLEVLAKDDEDDVGDGETPALWESCWMPILNAFADGATDDRMQVRCAAVHALSCAIVDRHVSAVPAGVLVNILGDIVVPTLLLLGESQIANESRGSTPDAKAKGKSKSVLLSPAAADVSIENLSSISAAYVKTVNLNLSNSPICQLLAALSSTYLTQLHKLSSYPSFDKLWLRLLHVLGYFLGAPHGFEHNRGLISDHLHLAVDECKKHLEMMLQTMVASEVFKNRVGLWTITQESVHQCKNCPDLIEHIALKK